MTSAGRYLSRTLRLLALILTLAAVTPEVAAAATNLGNVGFGAIVIDNVHQHVFVSETSANAIAELDFQGNVLNTIPNVYKSYGMAIVGNYLYVAEFDSGTVARIDLTSQTPTLQSVATGLNAPVYVAGAGGKIWVGLGTGTRGLVSIDPASGATNEFSTTYSDLELAGSPGDPNALYVADGYISPGAVERLDVTQSPPAQAASNSSTPQSNIRDIAASPDGTRVIPAGGSPYYFEELCAANLQPDGIQYPADSYPSAVAISQSGLLAGGLENLATPNVYVYKLGVPSAFFTATASGSQGVQPHGLALTADGSKLFAVSLDSNGNTLVDSYSLPAPPSTAGTNPCPAVRTGSDTGSGSGSSSDPGTGTSGSSAPGPLAKTPGTGGSSGSSSTASGAPSAAGTRQLPQTVKGSLSVRLKRAAHRPAAAFLMNVQLRPLVNAAGQPSQYSFTIVLRRLRCVAGATRLLVSIGARRTYVPCHASPSPLTGRVPAAAKYLIGIRAVGVRRQRSPAGATYYLRIGAPLASDISARAPVQNG